MALLTAILVVLGLLSAVPATASVGTAAHTADMVVKTADLTKFEAGNIISDAVFFDRDTMSAEQIQSFLQAKVPNCQAGYTCLKDWYDTSRTTTPDAMCGAYSGGIRERASAIIFKVAQACGINPQVLLATLQKEQGLVLHTWPSEWRYTIAMGQGCPDTAACDTRYYGFFNQVYGAAWQFKRYANPPGTSQYFTWYAPGKTWNVRYNPNAACGSSPVFIQNQATANLYYYTPYQPNAAALRAGYSEGDGCSAYGNRNFYQYFTDWFGSTHVPANACSQPSSSAVMPADGEYFVAVAALNARTAPSTACEPVARSLAAGTIVTRVGVYGDWWRIRISGEHFWVYGAYLTQTQAVPYTTSRVAGADRFETAVEVSKRTYPSGASTVFLASGIDFPDALAASAAAGRIGGSLLLTEPTALVGTTAAEIARLAPARVVLIGGEARISSDIASQIAALLPDAAMERIAGRDRYETSRLIATEFFPGATAAYVATGDAFPDAIVAASLGGAQGRPVILVNGAAPRLDPSTTVTLRSAGFGSVIVVGGADRVSAGVVADITATGIAAQRIAGTSRYETARLLVAAAYPNGTPKVLMATGENFPDALVGGVLSARTLSPLLTTPATCLDGGTKDWMLAAGVTNVTLLGGVPSLNDAVAKSVRC
ncbi:cell wall-binding repeat-containing protein [Microbacterium sp. SS28]|uniref:cell wall-binding repeat-containing protein n=1 Tax=Microbacterium sp. SS28 TaxID=2919948 RepID=UPI001FA9DFCD|nr:cell wall-binding repeat-containing protein [Microbacterium sp. SS28]